MDDAGSSRAAQVKKLAKMIHKIDFCMMTTVRADGSMHSRPMSTQPTEFDGDLWFFTQLDSTKSHEIKDNSQVNLSYAQPSDQRYISISGRATVLKDRAKEKELWSDLYKSWFPGGLDDPQVALIKVEIDQAEYWDSPGIKMVQLFGYLKAKLTGEGVEGGENKTIDLRDSKSQV